MSAAIDLTIWLGSVAGGLAVVAVFIGRVSRRPAVVPVRKARGRR